MTARLRLFTAAMALLAACQQPQPAATGPSYPGEPLFAVKGEMALTSGGTAPAGPIRLAVGWYPDDSSTSAPRAMVTQEVAYQGTFPLSYSFSFFSVPPAAALNDYSINGVTHRASFGVLMAYEDVNNNGQLDTIAAGGSPVDRVLGTSLGDRFNGDHSPEQVYVAYVDGTPPSEWAGYSAGYQLWKDTQVVPATTAVNIPLHQTNELNFFVCEEFINGKGYDYDLPCNIAPTGGMRIIGNVYRLNGVGGVGLRITDGTASLANIAVEVNGDPVPYLPAEELYTASGVTVIAPGRNVLRVTMPGQPARIFEMDAPADFALQSPAEGDRVFAQAPVALSWTRAAGATFYQAGGYRLTPPFDPTSVALVYDLGQSQLGASLTGVDADDYYQLQVGAFTSNYLAQGLGGSMVNAQTIRQQYVNAIPATNGLSLEGTVSHITYDGQTYGSVWVAAYDGVTALSTAAVTMNNESLEYVPAYGQFALDTTLLSPGDTANLVVTGNGKGPARSDVTLPGDFTVTMPASHQASLPLVVSWTASSGTTSYRVTLSDEQGQTLFTDVTGGLTMTVPAQQVTGTFAISVYAVMPHPTDRHLQGVVQKSFAISLTP